jgi:SnoaL-like polyketide cyclase
MALADLARCCPRLNSFVWTNFVPKGEFMNNGLESVQRMFWKEHEARTRRVREKPLSGCGSPSPICAFEDSDVIACGDRVVVVTDMCGVQTGSFMGMTPTHRNFRQRQVHIFRVDPTGRISEHLAVRDDLGLRRQQAR